MVFAFGLLAALADRGIHIPSAGSVFLVAVVYASFNGGIRVGLVASAMAETALVLYHWRSGTYSQEVVGTGGAVADALAFGSCTIAATFLVGALRLRSERRLTHEREHRERMAELEQVKSNFLNVASHELRGPLSVARGYASMLADGSFGPANATDTRIAVPVIATKLDEMNQLVDSMLDTARLEERRLVLGNENLDLREVVDHGVAAVQLNVTPNHVLRWRRPRQAVVVDGDRARLSIIVTNLLQNAIKYSPAGGIVEVFLAADGRQATLTVWDHGLGISDDDMPRLFTRFGRIVTPTNSHIPGTGLGLYLARELARLHGGDLVAASAAGHGSSFTLVIPMPSTPIEGLTDPVAAPGDPVTPEPLLPAPTGPTPTRIKAAN
ncbi:MAG TPA: HAMP domain-containing sensor histidine kinase [Candidatus Dormibacteraeota bacterium]|nr:HAMP domain-containing sensor histidine kinase [Candidatus Dormibacteraeota bacterium]